MLNSKEISGFFLLMNLYFSIYGALEGVIFMAVGDIIIVSIFYCLLKENNRIKGKVKYSIVISLMVTYLISIFYFKANMLAILMVSVTPFIFLFLIHAFYKPFVKNK